MPGFTGVISDLGGPTANMYRLRCKSPKAEQTCRHAPPASGRPSARTWTPTTARPSTSIARRATLKGHQEDLIASGVRYDIAVEDPRYIRSWPSTTSAATSRSRRNPKRARSPR